MFGRVKGKGEVLYEVLESDGVRGVRFKVKGVKAYTDGLVLVYEKGPGTAERVYVGRKYRPLLVDGRYLVGKNVGNNSGAILISDIAIKRDLGLEDKDCWLSGAVSVVGSSTDPDCPGEDLSRLVASDILGIGARAVRKKSYLIWLLVGIGVVVIVAIFLYARSHM